MRHPTTLKTLAAAIALAACSLSAEAATTTVQLPGQGRVLSGNVTVGGLDAAAGTMNLNLQGPVVINWGKGAGPGDINPGGVAGFNIGSGAHVNFTGSAGAAVLNIDSSGQPSRILGTLTAQGANVFVANGNGIIVGRQASVVSSGVVGLIGNRLSSGAAGRFDGSARSIAYGGHGGDVTVLEGASFHGGGRVLIAGGGNVNVDLSAFAGPVSLSAGRASAAAGGSASDNRYASLVTHGSGRGRIEGFSSAGTATNHGALSLSSAQVDGDFRNYGVLDLAAGASLAGRLINHATVHAHGDLTLGGLVNLGWLSTRGLLGVDNRLFNRGMIYSANAAGQIQVTGVLVNQGRIHGVSYVGTIGADLINAGRIDLVDANDASGMPGTVSVVGGDLVNHGRIHGGASAGLQATVTNGNIRNDGTLADFGSIATASDTTAIGFSRGADYSITNTGTIRGDAAIDANFSGRAQDNDSTGSFLNSGTLDTAGTLAVSANDNLTLDGKVLLDGGVLGRGHALDGVSLTAHQGKLTVGTPLVFYADGRNSGAAYLMGRKVELGASVTGVGADAGIYVLAGRRSDGSYRLVVDPGARLSASHVNVSGW